MKKYRLSIRDKIYLKLSRSGVFNPIHAAPRCVIKIKNYLNNLNHTNVHDVPFGEYLYLRTDFFSIRSTQKIFDEHLENTLCIVDELVSEETSLAFSLKTFIFF